MRQRRATSPCRSTVRWRTAKYEATRSSPACTVYRYRYGSDGDHRRGADHAKKACPPCSAPVCCPSGAIKETVPSVGPSTEISTPSSEHTACTARIYDRHTLSSHTVCQIPEIGVYHIPPRRSRCFPYGYTPSLSASRTQTSNRFSGCRYSEMSKENGS